MSEIWPGHDYDDWKGDKHDCATPQLYYLLLVTAVGVISFVLGGCTVFLILR